VPAYYWQCSFCGRINTAPTRPPPCTHGHDGADSLHARARSYLTALGEYHRVDMDEEVARALPSDILADMVKAKPPADDDVFEYLLGPPSKKRRKGGGRGKKRKTRRKRRRKKRKTRRRRRRKRKTRRKKRKKKKTRRR